MLHDRYDCTLQMGGSDQWGNITAGIDLIRRTRDKKAHALVFPLLTTTSGHKFGKTERGGVWLDPRLTSPFQFYQFWFNTSDADVIRHLKLFTLLSESEITGLQESTMDNPGKREAQRRLAGEITRMVHGDSEVAKVQRASRALFGDALEGLSAQDLLEIFCDVPSSSIGKHLLGHGGINLVDLLITCGLAGSRGNARRLIEGGGIYINNRRVIDYECTVSLGEAIEGTVVVLRKGAREHHLVRFVE